jgi:hypothetical protein
MSWPDAFLASVSLVTIVAGACFVLWLSSQR